MQPNRTVIPESQLFQLIREALLHGASVTFEEVRITEHVSQARVVLRQGEYKLTRVIDAGAPELEACQGVYQFLTHYPAPLPEGHNS